MKKFYAVPALLFIIMSFASCGKDAIAPTTPSSLSVTFNGKAITSANPAAEFSTAKDAMQINGQTTGNVSVEVVIYKNMQVGSFDVAGGEASIIYTNGTDVYTATSGTVTVSSFSIGRVTGAFQFAAMDTSAATVSGNTGSFNTAYSSQ
jgi:hypothetical protein